MLQLMLSFDGNIPPDDVLDSVRRGATAAFCLFGFKNGTTPEEIRAICERIEAAAREGGQLPPLIGIDQEGGQLMAISKGMTQLPGNMAIGATRDPALAEAAGRVLARELLAMGVNLNFAPSLDVNSNPENPVIGARAFGDDAEWVGTLGTAMIRGMQAEGLLASAKHFPGHGDVQTDTHFGAPVINQPRARIEAVELRPFRLAIERGVDAIMSAHILLNAIDSRNPATLSRAVMTDLLRGEMRFAGLTITDAMDMQAVAARGAEVAVSQALDAGNDLILLGHLPDQLSLVERLAGRVNPAAAGRIQSAQQRVSRERPGFDVLGCAEHQAVAREIAERSITLVKDDGERLPLRLSPDQRVAVITPEPVNLTPADTSAAVEIGLAEAIHAYHPRTTGYQLAHRATYDDVAALVETVAEADIVIVGTVSATGHEAQKALVNTLHARGSRPIVIALRTPYDLAAFPSVETYLCTYSIRRPSIDALARCLFGEITPTGVLPCALPTGVG